MPRLPASLPLARPAALQVKASAAVPRFRKAGQLNKPPKSGIYRSARFPGGEDIKEAIMTGLALILIIAALILLLLMRASTFIRRLMVMEYQKGLLYKKGRFQDIIDPGVYWYSPLNTEIKVVDTRRRYATLSGQEIMSRDGVSLKISLAVNYQVTDPVIAVNEVESFYEAMHLEIQLCLREIIGAEEIEHLLEKRSGMGERLMESAADKVGALGIELLSVDVKDIMFPGELKKIFSQAARARQEGLALLERARGETAALRNLANAAKMLDKNPSMMQLRLIQALGESSGHTVILGTPPPMVQVATPLDKTEVGEEE